MKHDKPLQRKELTYAEYHGLRGIGAVISELVEIDKVIKPRLRLIPYGKMRFKCAKGALESLFDDVILTCPESKLKQIKTELRNMYLLIRTKNYGGKIEDDCAVLPENTVLKLCKFAQGNECYMCEKTGDAVRKCELRKLLDESISYKPPRTQNGSCIYTERSIENLTGKTFEELVREEMENE